MSEMTPRQAEVARFERLLSETWRELLEVQDVGPESDFIELGGNSLLATIVANRIEEAAGWRPSMTDVFSHTLGELARKCADGVASNSGSAGA